MFNKFVLTALVLVFVATPLTSSKARSAKERFCIQQIDTPQREDGSEIVRIDRIQNFENSKHSIYFLERGRNFHGWPALLQDDGFKFLDFEAKAFISTPDGTILTHAGRMGETPEIFILNNKHKNFHLHKLHNNTPVPERISRMAWSTPLNGVLIAQGGTLGMHGAKKEIPHLYLMQGNKLELFKGVSGSITRIFDFPDLNITFLSTDEEDRVYIIDGNKQVHLVGALNLDRWIYFRNVYHLEKPDRLLIKAEEVKGPFEGLFQINLVKKDVWEPAKFHKLGNLIESFKRPNKNYQSQQISFYYDEEVGKYFVGGRNYDGIKGYYLGMFPRPKRDVPSKLYEVGDGEIKEVPYLSDGIINRRKNYWLNYKKISIDMPDSNATLEIKESGVYAQKKDGSETLLDKDLIDYDYTNMRHSRYQKHDKSVFISAANGFFLIKDKELLGDNACN